MTTPKLIGAAVLALSATVADAAIVTFAQFSAVGSASNVRWVNNGAAQTTTATNTANGTSGYFYTTSTGTASAPGSVAVNFEFLQPALASLGPISANFLMNVSIANTPGTTSGSFSIRDVPAGGFSFTNTSAFMVGATTYAAGSNLLTGTFTSGTIFGRQTAGSFTGDSVSGSLVYTSDVLNFTNTVDRDYALSMTSISPILSMSTIGGPTALRTFRALATGTFASDPVPVINAIPEPVTWTLMVVGFGLVGVQVRRRNRQSAIAG